MHLSHLVLAVVLGAVSVSCDVCEDERRRCANDFEFDNFVAGDAAETCRAAATYRACLDGAENFCRRVYPQDLTDAEAACPADVDYLSDCGFAQARCEIELQEEIEESQDDHEKCQAVKYFPSCLDNEECFQEDAGYPFAVLSSKYEEFCPSCTNANEACKETFDSDFANAGDSRFAKCGVTMAFQACREKIDDRFCNRKYEDEYQAAYDEFCASQGR